MGNRDYLPDLGSRFAEVCEVTHRILLEHVFADYTTFAIPLAVVNALAPRAEELYAYHVRYMLLGGVGVPRILRGFEVVKYVQYTAA